MLPCVLFISYLGARRDWHFQVGFSFSQLWKVVGGDPRLGLAGGSIQPPGIRTIQNYCQSLSLYYHNHVLSTSIVISILFSSY